MLAGETGLQPRGADAGTCTRARTQPPAATAGESSSRRHVLLAMLYTSSLPVETNPFVDLHVVYALAIIALAVTRVGERYGLGRWWARTALVRALPWLR